LKSYIFAYNSNRLSSLKILSWVVVWSHWCRTRKIQLSFYMVLTGAKKICRRQNWFVHFISEVTLGFHSSLLFSSCLEWRYTYPLLEEAGIETWAIDILGWGFSDLGLLHYFSYVMFIPFSLHFSHVFFSLIYTSEKLPSCDVVSKREHFYQVHVC
jgi:hypothetical protein